MRVGKPEKVRTAPCLVAPLWPCVAGGQTGGGCLFRPPFLWFISFGGAKEPERSGARRSQMNKNPKKKRVPSKTPSFLFLGFDKLYHMYLKQQR